MGSNDFIVSYKDNIQIITLNRPNKKNAIHLEMYIGLTGILNSAASNDDILITVITGAGDFFSSGNDLKSALGGLESFTVIIKNFVDAFISFPKILVAVVNGPAIGIAATTLPLYDLVFAAKDAYFQTPFTKLGIVAEGCSTYTFPKIMGRLKAADMLMFNYKMSSEEALQHGFVNYVFKPEELQSLVWEKILEVASLPRNSVLYSKKLLTSYNREDLLQANVRETNEISNILTSDEFFEILKVFANKQNHASKL